MESNNNNKNDLDRIMSSSILSNPEIILDIFYSDSNPARIESIEILKVNSVIQRVKNHKTYKLESYTSSITKIHIEINKQFIKSIDNAMSVEIVRYFDRGLFKNIFTKRDPNFILGKLTNCTWVITSKKISDELSTLVNFVKSDVSDSNFMKSGVIGDISIYISNDISDDEIFIGDVNSIGAIFKSNIKNFNDLITIEFLIYNNGVRKIILQ
jgi:hypothetical protein